MEKKNYEKPKMEIVELAYESQILAGSDSSWFDGKPDAVCSHGHNPHCED